MAKTNGPNHVYCYHCGRRIEIGRRTMSTPCPGCHKTVLVEDIVVKGYTGVNNFETCGRLIVRRRGHAVAKHRVVALAGIEVQVQDFVHPEYDQPFGDFLPDMSTADLLCNCGPDALPLLRSANGRAPLSKEDPL